MFPHVSTEALMCALVLSEEGNLIRTAERLHTSHYSVGRKLKMLQNAWGVEFFRRNLTGFELTDEGRLAVREFRKSIEHMQRGFDQAIYLSVKRRRPLLVGHSLYIYRKVLPYLEKQSISSSEFSRIELKADTTVHLVNRVLRGLLHVGFGVAPVEDKDLWVAPIVSGIFRHLYSGRSSIQGQIAASPFTILSTKPSTGCLVPCILPSSGRGVVTEYLHGIGIQPHNLHEARAIIQGIDLAASGLGVALVPESAARFQYPGVLFKPLADKLIHIETTVFARRDQMRGAPGDFVQAAIAELSPRKLRLQ